MIGMKKTILFLFTITFIISLFAYSHSINAQGTASLVGLWKLNDGSGTTVTDSSGAGNSGVFSSESTKTSSPVWLSGGSGSAIRFNGINNYVQVNATPIKNENTWSMAFWMYPLNVATANDVVIVNINSCYNVRLNRNNIGFQYPGSFFYTPFSSEVKWSHIAVIADGSNFRFYINGSEVKNVAQSACSNTATSFIIGHTADTSYQGRGIDGSIADLRFYTGSLTQEEIQAMYSSGSPANLASIPPIRVSTTPVGALTAGTASAPLSLTTDKASICKYSTSANTPYESMSGTLSSNAVTSHSVSVSGLTAGINSFFIKCKDSMGNENSDDLSISISISHPEKSDTPVDTTKIDEKAPAQVIDPSQTNFFVSPAGKSTNKGTIDSPWDIATAFSGANGLVKPGHNIWLREGVYNKPTDIKLAGTKSSPITIRNYNRERAILDGNGIPSAFMLYGSYYRLWGLEIRDSGKASINADPYTVMNIGGTGISYINNISHDGGMGIANGDEAYGNIMYYNGKTPREHGIYWQNDYSKSGVIKVIKDNIILNPSGLGIHSYSQAGQLSGFLYEGNTVYNAQSGAEILVGGGNPIDNVTIKNNMIYHTPGVSAGSGGGLQLGYYFDPNINAVIRNNYISENGSAMIFHKPFSSVTMRDNTFIAMYHPLSINLGSKNIFKSGSFDIDYNTYHNLLSNQKPVFYNNAPDKNNTLAEWKKDTGFDSHSTESVGKPADRVFVRPNQYESGRANITIYNWSQSGSVNVDVSGILNSGDIYELHSAQDYFGDVTVATYQGGPLSIRMTGRSVASPISGHAGVSTFPEFGAFVLIKTNTSISNTPPSYIPPATAINTVTNDSNPIIIKKEESIKNNDVAKTIIPPIIPKDITPNEIIKPIILVNPNMVVASPPPKTPAVKSNQNQNDYKQWPIVNKKEASDNASIYTKVVTVTEENPYIEIKAPSEEFVPVTHDYVSVKDYIKEIIKETVSIIKNSPKDLYLRIKDGIENTF